MEVVNGSDTKTDKGTKKSPRLILILVLILVLLLCVLFVRNRDKIFIRLSVNRSIYFNKRDMPDKAVRELLKAYKLAPNSPEIIHNMMESYFLLKDYEKATTFAKQILTLDSADKDALWMIGFINQDKGKEDEALQYFGKLYSLFKSRMDYIKNTRFLFAVSYLELRRSQFSLAIRDLEILTDLLSKGDKMNPLLQWSYLMLGEAYTAIGNYTDASKIYKDLIDVDKNFALSYLKLGFISFGLHNFSDFLYYLDLTEHYGLDSYQEFVNYFKNEYEKNRSGVSDFLLVGDCYISKQELVNKVQDYYYLGYVYRKLNENEKAIETYKKILELLPDVKGIYYAIGRIYEDKKDFEKAKENYLKELETNPVYYEALIGLKRIEPKLKGEEVKLVVEKFNKKLEEKMLKEINYNQMYNQDGSLNTKRTINSIYSDFEVMEDRDYSFMIIVSGKQALGTYPLISVFINGALISKFYIDSEDDKICFANKILKKGNHRLKINFDNDYYDSSKGEDRNLYLSRVVIFK